MQSTRETYYDNDGRSQGSAPATISASARDPLTLALIRRPLPRSWIS